ncbi:hypothetical protein BU23DRAFT_551283 [Bimuria novae-zelandiae CBS 107.79]|uniref:Uncharacterized protein n=1 Tax=Bimuria novae-zelandiae CBS 107.79 TaxID=1447943 RepID=A0A6A5VJM2_9PLEO|nr:hypothetical protein BU23DRAFT_551283 [Bimuria novae-zelandiae CBS 107.79]
MQEKKRLDKWLRCLLLYGAWRTAFQQGVFGFSVQNPFLFWFVVIAIKDCCSSGETYLQEARRQGSYELADESAAYLAARVDMTIC